MYHVKWCVLWHHKEGHTLLLLRCFKALGECNGQVWEAFTACICIFQPQWHHLNAKVRINCNWIIFILDREPVKCPPLRMADSVVRHKKGHTLLLGCFKALVDYNGKGRYVSSHIYSISGVTICTNGWNELTSSSASSKPSQCPLVSWQIMPVLWHTEGHALLTRCFNVNALSVYMRQVWDASSCISQPL